MEKHIFNEQTGIGYTLQGDYYLPNLAVSDEKEQYIGLWGCGCPVDTSKRSLETPTEPAGETAAFKIHKRAPQGFILQSADKRKIERLSCRYQQTSRKDV